MALSLTVKKGYTLQDGIPLTPQQINMMWDSATFYLEGEVSSVSLGDGSVTGPKLAAGAVDDVTKVAPNILTLDRTNVDYRWASVIGGCRNLVVKNDNAAPNNKLNITADEVVLKNAAGGAYLATVVSVNADITTSGANGLDTGSEASDTWYFVWLIYNGTLLSSLLSTSATAPSLPVGYTHKVLVAVVRNNAGSNFIGLYQQDRCIFIVAQNALSNQSVAVADTYESLSLASVVPSIAKSVFGTIGGSVATGTAQTFAAAAGNAAGIGECRVVMTSTGTAFGLFFGAGHFEVPCITAQTLYWKSLTTAAKVEIDIGGYTI